MSLFLEPLPNSVTVLGKAYPVCTDFRTWAAVEHLLFESDLPQEEKLGNMLALCFRGKKLPPDFSETVSALFDFYRCFEKQATGKENGDVLRTRVLSLYYDAPYLYAAMLAQYGVDLTKENPHWFLFCAMLKGLREEHKICAIMGYRSVKLSEITDKQKRAFFVRCKKRYRLPECRTEEEIARETAEGLAALF